ncbi:carboxylating nicotinate-nucleotide diphosphorylase [Alkaliflexus imshenetskii]|uniref:carboxylating nicotinate-nucleotide diphosphorylase n=1 Tax=Alkaliflexus imshenetskii TaxID=286730 RepID=UPI00047919B0|nr:carboxylating nicotinate-nucleotide diphosphorylase [Alkaliflexus imshenetskii]
MNKRVLRKFINDALDEDIGDGDHSSMACIPPDAKGKAALLVKENGVLAGVEVAMAIFREVEPDIKIEQILSDGDGIKPGDVAFTVEGTVWTLLKAERLALNVMQRMSGIATRTRQYVDELNGLQTKILDTRKTTPGMRFLEKEAVKIGGGKNHRFGLYDMIMLKDNHIDFAGGIEKAILSANNYINKAGKNLKIEVEVRNLEELNEVLRVGQVNRIMLDNFDVATTREAVKLINGRFETESSGAITLETIRAYAETGVDYISVGALTHHIKSLDLSLKAMD